MVKTRFWQSQRMTCFMTKSFLFLYLCSICFAIIWCVTPLRSFSPLIAFITISLYFGVLFLFLLPDPCLPLVLTRRLRLEGIGAWLRGSESLSIALPILLRDAELTIKSDRLKILIHKEVSDVTETSYAVWRHNRFYYWGKRISFALMYQSLRAHYFLGPTNSQLNQFCTKYSAIKTRCNDIKWW